MIRRLALPAILGLLVYGFWISPNFQVICAGVAIFLFGVLLMEQGFRLFSGGYLERALEASTNKLWKSMSFGIVSTTVMQSSSFVSVITISFLSAGLLPLVAGIGIIFGANIGTTTGAWLVAGFGLKVNISAYAMPMLAVGIVLVFQSTRWLKGVGYVIAGVGFLFLGIHNMKEGFAAFQDQVDLSQLAMTGFLGLIVYTLAGAVATVIMQSSHATMVLIITALAAGQVTYENALALAIGANIGTTVTAVLGSLSANFQGKRLAMAHLVFNAVTAIVAIVLIGQIRLVVDTVSQGVGIAGDDYTLKLAVFHTVFNVLGVILMTPLMGRLVALVEKAVPPPSRDVSQPRFLNSAVIEFPATVIEAMRNEVQRLYDHATEIIAHGLNLHRSRITGTSDLTDVVSDSRRIIEFDLDQRYEERVKSLHAAIVEFTTRTSQNLHGKDAETAYKLRDVSAKVVEAVKAIKHLRKNVNRFTTRDTGSMRALYNEMRMEIAEIMREIHRLQHADPEERTTLWLDEALAELETARRDLDRRVDTLIRDDSVTAEQATSFLNDSGYAYSAMRNLIDVARELYAAPDEALAEIERMIALEEDELDQVAPPPPVAEPEHRTGTER